MGKRRPSQVVNAEINQLRRYLENNLDKNDVEIMQELGINSRRYYRYKDKIREQDKQAWLEMAKESLESAAFKVKKSLDYAIKIYKDVADNAADQRARIEAARKLVECQIMFYRMLEKGPTSKTIILPKVTENSTPAEDRGLESMGANTIPTTN
jgi:hypothetical protein